MKPDKPSERAFTGRKLHTNKGGYTAPETNFKSAKREETTNKITKRLSSFPHLTPKTDKRVEHITDVRLIGYQKHPETQEDMTIMQRYHQDNSTGSKPMHDRFIAVGSKGQIYNATAKLREDTHVGKFDKVPERDEPIQEKYLDKLSFEVGDVTTDPPLSPRTRKRDKMGY